MFAAWSLNSWRFSWQACIGSGTFAAMLIMASSAGAQTQTACIRCSGPEATYICTATSDEPFRDKAIGLFCASRIAANRQHHSCAALRADDPCTGGVSVSFAYDSTDSGSSMLPPATPPAQAQPQREVKKETDNNGEPETLTEFAKEAVDGSVTAVKKAGKATGDALKDTGNAIGDATKKTLKCLGSALNDC